MHAEERAPWRLSGALESPAWLRFGLEQRTRFERLKDDFRATHAGDSTGVLLRTLLDVQLVSGPFTADVELIDARAYTTDGTPLNTTLIDPLDVLQAHGRLRAADVLAAGDALTVTIGRQTMDLGSRRLLARNAFRNTINAFDGVDLQWSRAKQHALRTFAVMPVRRLPQDADALGDNELELDRGNTNAVLWGAYAGAVRSEGQVEGYVLGLHERDGVDTASTNRQLVTAGARALRTPRAGRLDFQVEGIVQLGTSRASTMATDTEDLSHRAASAHASIGYQHDHAWKPRAALSYDFASGDGDPDDGVAGRFDPLFGARRFDFGPTSLYGAIARTNVNTPGVKLEAAPRTGLDGFVGYRAVWLAAARDAWVPAGLRDRTGDAGTFVGQQVEAQVRWSALPKNLAVELDAAYLIRGGFAREVANRTAPATYVAVQVALTI